MSKIAYLILCHKDTDLVGDWIDAHLATGNFVAVHLDGNAPDKDYNHLIERFGSNENVAIVPRIKCGWGEWSLVQATLSLLETAAKKFKRATHFFLTSGECFPIKPAFYIQNSLDEDSVDYIENQDFVRSGWIKTGMVEDRYKYRHYFNERKQRRLFYQTLKLQRFFGIARTPPNGIEMKIGSQWWCLRRKTAEAVLGFIKENPNVLKFFKTVWIPDESFFQTIVAHLIPKEQIRNHPPTFLTFSDYGMPVVFHTDHLDHLKEQPRFFARKASAHQKDLRRKFAELYESKDSYVRISDKGQKVYDFTVKAGREGRRFELQKYVTGGSIGRERSVHVIMCKDWSIGKTVASQLGMLKQQLALGYVFQEDDANLPDLGGFEKGKDKRGRHRRAFINTLMDIEEIDDLILCVDPAFTDILRDFESDRCKTKFLMIDINLTDEFCAGHAYRLDLLESPDPKEDPSIIRTLRHNLISEQQHVADMGLRSLSIVKPNDTERGKLRALQKFGDAEDRIATEILKNIGYMDEGASNVVSL